MHTGCLPDARAGTETWKVKGKAYRGIARIPFSCPIGAFVRPVRGCAVGSPSRDAAMRGATRAAISPEWKHAARAAAAAQSQCAPRTEPRKRQAILAARRYPEFRA